MHKCFIKHLVKASDHQQATILKGNIKNESYDNY